MLSKWIFLLFATVVMSVLSGDVEIRKSVHVARSEEYARQTRSALKPIGFFGKLAYMGGLLFQQFNETKSAFGRISDIINDGFTDTATKPPPTLRTTTKRSEGSEDVEADTTTEKFRISRAEFGKIISRNLRGLQRLLKIELADSKNQSQFTVNEYKQQLYDQIKPKGGIYEKRINLTVTNTV